MSVSIKQVELVILALTGACNLACTYCYASKQTTQTMSLEVVEAVIALLEAQIGPTTVQITGGEPLLASDWMQKIVKALAHKKNITFQLQTNGTLLTRDLVRFLKQYKVAIGISLDGVPEINDQLRPSQTGDASTMKIIQNIQLLAEMGIPIGLTCVVGRANVHQLPKLVDLAYYLGNIRQIGFNLVRPQGRGEGIESATAREVAEGISAALQRVDQLSKLTGVVIHISQMERTCALQKGYKPFSHCYALHKEGLYIDPVGDLYACASLSGREEYRLGNLLTGFDEEKEKQLIAKIQPIVDYCSQCDDITYCGGACYSRSDDGKTVKAAECALKRVCIDAFKRKKETSR